MSLYALLVGVYSLLAVWKETSAWHEVGDLPLELQAGPREDHGPSVRLAAAVPRLPPDAAARLFTPLWARQALGLSAGLSLTSARNAFLRHRGDLVARQLPDGALLLEGRLPLDSQATFEFPA